MLDRAAPMAMAWAPVVVWAGLIFVFSAQPDLRFLPDEGLDFVVRKLGHAAVFGILALLVWRAVRATPLRDRATPWSLALTVLYAIPDELHQGGVIGRNASGVDVGIDAAGALIALGGLAIIRSGRNSGGRRARHQ